MHPAMRSVGLVMIVKNEAPILPRLAESVVPHIDHWTIVDTGSTDLTEDTINTVFSEVPGQLLRHEFNGFGPSRCVALEAAEPHTDWLLVLDADETFHGYIDGLEGDTDCFEAEQHNGDMRFWLPRLLRSGAGWRSRGRAHEYYFSPTARRPMRTQSFHIEHHGDGHDRPEKFLRDSELLMRDWDEEHNARTAFYLARTWQDSGHPVQAEKWYRERLQLPGWDEENFMARYGLGLVLFDLGRGEEACGHLWRAWGEKTDRAEPLVALAAYYRMSEQWQLAYLAAELAFGFAHAQPGNQLPRHDGLFVDTTAAGWRAAYEQSISSWYLGHKERGKMLSDWLVGVANIPEPYASSAASNREFYSS